jgi:hypothetical protein
LNHNTAANLNAASEVIGMSAFGAEPEIVLPIRTFPVMDSGCVKIGSFGVILAT